MTRILCTDTSTKACSVALCIDGECHHEVIVNEEGYRHAEQLHVLIERVLKVSNLTSTDLDAIAVGAGPGSYTGLRIGVSAAKGLSYSLGIPLIAIPSLQVMAAGAVSSDYEATARYRPLMDARRMEVYSAMYNNELTEQESTAAHIIDEESFGKELSLGPVYFFGDGMEKCREVLSRHANAQFIDNVHPLGGQMCRLAQQLFESKRFVDTAYFEPFYLKEFKAGLPKKMV